jgi:hypothetical protein
MRRVVRIGACQTPEILGDVEAAVGCIIGFCEQAEDWKHRHNQIRAERVKETGMWLVSADVTGERGDTRVGLGPTSIMNPSAHVVAQVPLMETGMVVAEIPA